MKRLCFLLLFSLLITAIPSVAADTGVSPAEDAEAVLADLGFMEKGWSPDDLITKAEFAAVLVKLAAIDGYVGKDAGFADLPAGHAYYQQVQAAASLGILSGSEDGKVNPDDPLTYNQAVKMLVCALGYGVYAQTKGGYPTGYLLTAAERRLDKNVTLKGEEWVVKSDAALLVYNALDTNLMEATGFGSETTYDVTPGNTPLSRYHKIEKRTGQVKGIKELKLQPGLKIGTDEIVIDSTLYHTAKQGLAELVGCSVEFYCRTDTEPEEILSIRPRRNKNTVLTISLDNVLSASGMNITYRDGEDKEREARLTVGTDILYNNAPIERYDPADFLGQEGSLRLIDADGDEQYDVLMIDVSKDFIVKTVDLANCMVYDMFDPSSPLLIDRDDPQYTITFQDEYGNDMSLEELTEWDVLTVMKSHDGKQLKIFYSNSEAEGTVESMETSNGALALVIDGKRYETSASFRKNNKVSLKDTGLFILNANHKIAAYRRGTSESTQLGYLIDAQAISAVDQTYQVKLLSQEGTVRILNMAQKVTVDGIKYAAPKNAAARLYDQGKFVPQLAQYRLNGAGELQYLDLAPRKEGDVLESANSLECHYASAGQIIYVRNTGIFGGKLPTKGSTLVFKVPQDPTNAVDKDYKVYDMSYFANGQNYAVEGYRVARDHYSADALVLYAQTGSASVDGNAPVTIVDKIQPALNEDGDIVQKLYGYRNGAAVEYLTREDNLLSSVSSLNAADNPVHELECGDIVQLEIDDHNEIVGVKLIYQRNIGKIGVGTASDPNARFRVYMGKAYAVSEGYLMLTTSALSDDLTLNSLEVYPGTILPIVVYDHTKENKLSVGKLGDIVDYKSTLQASDVFVYTSYSSNGMIVVYK